MKAERNVRGITSPRLTQLASGTVRLLQVSASIRVKPMTIRHLCAQNPFRLPFPCRHVNWAGTVKYLRIRLVCFFFLSSAKPEHTTPEHVASPSPTYPCPNPDLARSPPVEANPGLAVFPVRAPCVQSSAQGLAPWLLNGLSLDESSLGRSVCVHRQNSQRTSGSACTVATCRRPPWSVQWHRPWQSDGAPLLAWF